MHVTLAPMIPELAGASVLITGASRGVGASLARQFSAAGSDVVINYRSKQRRADEVAAEVRALGVRALVVQADITVEAEVDAMYAEVESEFGSLDVVVLNASGGLEKDKEETYAMRLNRDAQVELAEKALPLLKRGGRIVFVTSHLAHFFGEKPGLPGYEVVAASKQAGERELRARIDLFERHGVRLVVVSGDLIEGTITPKLLERKHPGLIEDRRDEAGDLPSVDEFAAAIVAASVDPALEQGGTVYVGAID